MSEKPIKPGTRRANGTFAHGIDQRLEHNAHWKGDAVSRDAARDRLKRQMPTIDRPCDQCGAKAHDRHHVDGNTRNNDLSNISILCRRCHMKADGRLGQFIKRNLSRLGIPMSQWKAHEKAAK